MKLKNIKYYGTTLLLAATLGLTGCSSKKVPNQEELLEELDQSTIESNSPEQENSTTNNTETYETKKIIDQINRHFNHSIVLHYYSSTGIITITGPYEDKSIPKLSDKLYAKLNSILEQPNVQTLEIHNIDGEIDFSKLNLSNIKNLTLDGCKTKFDYEPFKNQEYENITFEGILAEPAIEIIQNTTTQDTNIEFVNYNNNQAAADFIKFLADNQIAANSLNVATTECTKEDYASLCRTNITNIDIMFTAPSDQTYDLELYPNSNISSFNIWHTGKNIELGNIQVTSEYPFFYFAFNGYQSKITKNTSFNLPNYATASISAKYESGNALQDLSNLYAFDFYDYNTYKVISYDCEVNNLEELINEYTNTYQIKKELQ